MSDQIFDRGLFHEGTAWDDFSCNPTRGPPGIKAERSGRIEFFTDHVHGATQQLGEADIKTFCQKAAEQKAERAF